MPNEKPFINFEFTFIKVIWMPSQGSLGDLKPASGILEIIAGALIIVMVGPTLSGPYLQLEQLFVYGISVILIVAGIAAIYLAFK